MEKDLSKPFFISYRKGDYLITESNLPNDTIGDFAFEYDYDGKERKKWDEYIAELERNGTRGQLVYSRWEMLYNSDFDEPEVKNAFPLTSYKFIILNVTDE